MSKIKYVVIEKNKPSKEAIQNLNQYVYDLAKKNANDISHVKAV